MATASQKQTFATPIVPKRTKVQLKTEVKAEMEVEEGAEAMTQLEGTCKYAKGEFVSLSRFLSKEKTVPMLILSLFGFLTCVGQVYPPSSDA